MASVTLIESAKLAQNELVAGIIENIITVNRMFEVLPFDGIDGNALAYNRENALGDVGVFTIGDTISATAAATFTPKTASLTTIAGDALVNGLIQATRSSDGNDQTAVQVASKAKSCGRKFQDMLINGTGASNEFEGLDVLCVAGQTVDTGGNGSNLSFGILDNLLDLVVDKDGQVDYITMHARTLRSYFALLRGLGGASVNEVVTLPSGAQVPAYRQVPIFRNDYIPITQSKGSSLNTTTIFAGTLDDGSRQHGIAGLTAAQAAGIQVVDVGESETKDERVWRVKWYSGLALFSEKGLSCADGIKD
ncbi:MAG TPA: phage major capsid protein [Methylomirabilota bacterium]|nr:phage major capsid protein [Methylomirabilota bacterium]